MDLGGVNRDGYHNLWLSLREPDLLAAYLPMVFGRSGTTLDCWSQRLAARRWGFTINNGSAAGWEQTALGWGLNLTSGNNRNASIANFTSGGTGGFTRLGITVELLMWFGASPTAGQQFLNFNGSNIVIRVDSTNARFEMSTVASLTEHFLAPANGFTGHYWHLISGWHMVNVPTPESFLAAHCLDTGEILLSTKRTRIGTGNTSLNAIVIGGASAGSIAHPTFTLHALAIYDAYKPPQWAYRRFANPLEIIRPRRRVLTSATIAQLGTLSDGAVAGETVSATWHTSAIVSEGSVAGESLGAAQRTSAAISDGAASGDIIAAGLVGSTLEVVVAADALAGAIVKTGLLDEGNSASDTLSAAARLAAILSDGSGVGDLLLAAATIHVASAEGTDAGDSLFAVTSLPVVVGEGVQAGDAMSGAIVVGFSIDASAGDSLTSIATRLAADAEGANAGDDPSGAVRTIALTTDNVLSGETWLAGQNITDSVAQGATAGDSVAAARAAFVVSTEGLRAGDFLAANTTTVGLLQDGAIAADSIAASVRIGTTNLDGAQSGDTLGAITVASRTVASGVMSGDTFADDVLHGGNQFDTALINELFEATIIFVAPDALPLVGERTCARS